MFPYIASALDLTPYIASAIGGAVTVIILVITIIMITVLLKKQCSPAPITEPLYDNGVFESSSQINSK